MSRAPQDSEPAELLRLLAQESVPSTPEDGSAARRDRLVRQMKDAVERSAENAEKSRRLRRGAVAALAAASFLLLSGLWLRERGSHAVPARVAGLSGVSGTVVLTHDSKSNVITSGERTLDDGDALQTAAGARAHLRTPKSAISVSESTELRVSRPSAAEERISLRRGRVDVAVDKAIESTRAVVVETPDAEVVVRGTVFDVRVEPLASATNTHVHVSRGSVWVLAQGVQVALLSAGQSWSSATGVQTAEAPAPTPAPVAQPAGESEAPTPVSVTKPRVVPPRRAGTLAEENRLFSAGVEARNRGDAVKAAELFGELLSAYPQSTLREVAQVERFRALKGTGQSTRASTEARRYLAEHPDGAARSEARGLALDAKE